MKDKKAAKKLLKLAKEHPEWYSEEDVRYAKQVKWRIKQEKQEQKNPERNFFIDKTKTKMKTKNQTSNKDKQKSKKAFPFVLFAI